MKETPQQYLDRWQDIEWSASRVSSFKSCPYNFYGTYILGLKSDNFFSYRGSVVHQILEDYYTYLYMYDMPLDAIRKHLIGVFEQEMELCPFDAVMYYGGGVKKMNNNKIINSLKKWKPLSNVKFVEREIKFSVGAYKFRAFLDVEREYKKLAPSGKYETVTLHSDYKSSWNASKYEFQQHLYTYGKREVDKHTPAGFEIIEYNNNFKSVAIAYNKLKVKFVVSEAKEIIEDIKKALETNTFTKNPKDKFFCQNLCRMCEHGKTN